jgi:hypothetical protein
MWAGGKTWILGSRCSDYEEYYILGCEAVQSGISIPRFSRNILLPSSKQNSPNVGERLPDYSALHRRRQWYSSRKRNWFKARKVVRKSITCILFVACTLRFVLEEYNTSIPTYVFMA